MTAVPWPDRLLAVPFRIVYYLLLALGADPAATVVFGAVVLAALLVLMFVDESVKRVRHALRREADVRREADFDSHAEPAQRHPRADLGLFEIRRPPTAPVHHPVPRRPRRSAYTRFHRHLARRVRRIRAGRW